LSLCLHKGRRPSYRRSFQPSKENIQHFKTLLRSIEKSAFKKCVLWILNQDRGPDPGNQKPRKKKCFQEVAVQILNFFFLKIRITFFNFFFEHLQYRSTKTWILIKIYITIKWPESVLDSNLEGSADLDLRKAKIAPKKMLSIFAKKNYGSVFSILPLRMASILASLSLRRLL
jgi:hypothetical protein